MDEKVIQSCTLKVQETHSLLSAFNSEVAPLSKLYPTLQP